MREATDRLFSSRFWNVALSSASAAPSDSAMAVDERGAPVMNADSPNRSPGPEHHRAALDRADSLDQTNAPLLQQESFGARIAFAEEDLTRSEASSESLRAAARVRRTRSPP